MANADSPEDAVTARKNGAQGIGLCRTEHMVQQTLYFLLYLNQECEYLRQLISDILIISLRLS